MSSWMNWSSIWAAMGASPSLVVLVAPAGPERRMPRDDEFHVRGGGFAVGALSAKVEAVGNRIASASRPELVRHLHANSAL